MILDLIVLQISFILSYVLRHGLYNSYALPLYANTDMFLFLCDLVIIFFTKTFRNILKGDIRLVGTPPPPFSEFDEYEPHHRAGMSVKPGITGLWQISSWIPNTSTNGLWDWISEYCLKPQLPFSNKKVPCKNFTTSRCLSALYDQIRRQYNEQSSAYFLIGAKSLGAYGGYETFINKLTEYHQHDSRIKYHVACKKRRRIYG